MKAFLLNYQEIIPKPTIKQQKDLSYWKKSFKRAQKVSKKCMSIFFLLTLNEGWLIFWTKDFTQDKRMRLEKSISKSYNS